MIGPKRAAMVAAIMCLGWAAGAGAVDVYINDILVTGMTGQSFDDVSVRFDAQGNLRITAPNHRIERRETVDSGPAGRQTTTQTAPARTTSSPSSTPPSVAAAQPASARPVPGGQGLSQRYWLVVQSNAPGQVQYRVQITINGRQVRSFDDGSIPAPVEVTEHLRAGRNAVQIVADKVLSGGRRSESARHWMRVVVAAGHIDGTSVVIDSPQVIFTRNASQTDAASRDYTLNAQ